MKIRKLLALMMALMMTVCVFVACEDDEVANNTKEEQVEENKKKPEKELSDEDAVKAVMENFEALYFTGDERALEYLSEDAIGYADIKSGIAEIKTVEEKFKGLAESFGLSEEYDADVKKIGNEFINGIFGKMDIVVNDVEVDSDAAVAKCTFECPDFDHIETVIDEDLLNEAMSSVYTEEEMAAIDNADEKTQAEASLKLIDALFDLIVEKIKVVSEEIEYNFEKIDGRWMITSKN